MEVVFTIFAKQELEDASGFYELEFTGLGKRFKAEVKAAILRIIEYPALGSVERADMRKYLLHKFPYKLIYSIEADHIVIIAIAHTHRKPEYWVAGNPDKSGD